MFTAFAVATVIMYNPEDHASSVVLVQQEDGTGTAVHIKNGYFLTAAHVLERNQKSVKLSTNKDQQIQAQVLWTSAFYDIALLHTTDSASIAYNPINCSPLVFGEELRFAGNPSRLSFISIWGRVAGDYQYDISPRWYRVIPVNTTIVPGMSGGPVLDYKNNIRGINVGGLFYTLNFSETFTNISFIVSAEDICFLLKKY
jgi:S1-C subfamily serine protease